MEPLDQFHTSKAREICENGLVDEHMVVFAQSNQNAVTYELAGLELGRAAVGDVGLLGGLLAPA